MKDACRPGSASWIHINPVAKNFSPPFWNRNPAAFADNSPPSMSYESIFEKGFWDRPHQWILNFWALGRMVFFANIGCSMWPRVTTVLSHGRRTACPGLGCLGELTHPMRVAMGEILYGTPQNGCFKMVLFGETVIDHRFIFFLPSFFSDRHFSGMMWLDITGQPHGPSDSLQGIPIHNQSTAADGCL